MRVTTRSLAQLTLQTRLTTEPSKQISASSIRTPRHLELDNILMSKRERILAIAVLSIFGLMIVQWGFSHVSKVLDEKNSKLDGAIAESERLDQITSRGLRAKGRLDKLVKLSLPRDQQSALYQYRTFLESLSAAVDMEGVSIVTPESTAFQNKAFDAYNFSLQGDVELDKSIELIGRYYDKNYIHTIKECKFSMLESGKVRVNLISQVIALKAASKTQELADQSSGRLAMDIEEYKSRILARNPFAPPNAAPKLDKSSLEILVGKSLYHKFGAKDPEGHNVKYKLVTKEEDIPEGIEVDSKGISGVPTKPGKIEMEFEISDNGWPSASRTQSFVINVKEEVKTVTKEEPTLDLLTRTKVSGLVAGGRRGSEVWIRSQFEDKTLRLIVGEEFEIGGLKGKVIEIHPQEDYALLETDNVRWVAKMYVPFSEAYAEGLED